MEILGHGVYVLSEAAQLTGLKRARVREWFWRRVSDPVPRSIFDGE